MKALTNRKLLFIALAALMPAISVAETKVIVKPAIKIAIGKKGDTMPEYPGGMEAFYKYLASKVHYPKLARENNISGKVYVAFMVEKDGAVKSVTVLHGIGSGCDEEAVKAVAASGKWKPGKADGKVVRKVITVPISFTLTKA